MPAAPLPRSINIASWLLGLGLIALFFGVSRLASSGDQLIPTPYQVPTIPGGTSLRLAMIHDLFLERGERRSPTWHAARLAKRQATIASHADRADDAALWEAYDDAAVSLDALGRFDEGVALLREKLARLSPELPTDGMVETTLSALFASDATLRLQLFTQTLADDRLHAYRTFANLATLLAHGAMAHRDDRVARLTEARLWLGRALALHPGAHFGRELWQWVALDSVLAWQQDPDLMQRCDLFGRALDADAVAAPGMMVSRAYSHAAWRYLRNGGRIDPNREIRLGPGERARLRSTLTTHAPDPAWIAATGSRFQHPVPFDEPVLALIGMWWYGGGPNPISALTLAGICESIGQPILAWEGYARARFEIAQRSDVLAFASVDAFAAHRQSQLVAALGISATSLDASFTTALTEARMVKELWHDHEVAMLANGADVDDPTWLDAWRSDHPFATTRPGLEDWLAGTVQIGGTNDAQLFNQFLALLAIVLVVHVMRTWARRRYARDQNRLS